MQLTAVGHRPCSRPARPLDGYDDPGGVDTRRALTSWMRHCGDGPPASVSWPPFEECVSREDAEAPRGARLLLAQEHEEETSGNPHQLKVLRPVAREVVYWQSSADGAAQDLLSSQDSGRYRCHPARPHR